jgi:hypothetical protein
MNAGSSRLDWDNAELVLDPEKLTLAKARVVSASFQRFGKDAVKVSSDSMRAFIR